MKIKINLLEAVAAKAFQSGDIVYTEKNGKIDAMNVWKLGARRTSAARGIGDPKADRIKIEGFAASPCYTRNIRTGVSGIWSGKGHILSDNHLKKFKRTTLAGLVKAVLDGNVTGIKLKADERAKLEKTLARLKEKEKAAKSGVVPSKAEPAVEKAWFVVDTSTRPATKLSGPYPNKVTAESRQGVRPNRSVKRLPVDAPQKVRLEQPTVPKKPSKLIPSSKWELGEDKKGSVTAKKGAVVGLDDPILARVYKKLARPSFRPHVGDDLMLKAGPNDYYHLYVSIDQVVSNDVLVLTVGQTTRRGEQVLFARKEGIWYAKGAGVPAEYKKYL